MKESHGFHLQIMADLALAESPEVSRISPFSRRLSHKEQWRLSVVGLEKLKLVAGLHLNEAAHEIAPERQLRLI